MQLRVRIELRGRLFRDAPDVLERYIGYGVREIVEAGEQRLDEMLRPRPAGVYLSVQDAQKGKASTGYYRAHLHAVSRGLRGRIDDGKVVYGPWLEGVSTRNQATRFKGYASFRRTAQYLQERAPEIMEGQLNRAVRAING